MAFSSTFPSFGLAALIMLCVLPPKVQSLSSSFLGGPFHSTLAPKNNNHCTTLSMRDQSAATWYKVGDSVRVVDDVYKNREANLKGLQGQVVEVWEKCEVDPTCCCAEQVDENMAVRVQFETEDEVFFFHFAEAELEKIPDQDLNASNSI